MKLQVGILIFLAMWGFGLQLQAQEINGGRVYYVQTYDDGSPDPDGLNPPAQLTLRDAIVWANGYTTPGPIVIDINTICNEHSATYIPQGWSHAPNMNGQGAQYIKLWTQLPAIELKDGVHLTIRADKNLLLGIKAAEMVNNSVAPFHPAAVQYGLLINGGGLNTSVKLEKLRFTGWHNSLATITGYYQFSFAPCISAYDCKNLIVNNCEFIGYHVGVEYNNKTNVTITNNLFKTYADHKPMKWYDIPGFTPNEGIGYNPLDVSSSMAIYLGSTYPWTYLVDRDWTNLHYRTTAISLHGEYPVIAPDGPYLSTITTNIIENSGGIEMGSAIVIDPLNFFSAVHTVDMNQPVDMRATVNISDNIITNLAIGIEQGVVPPIRTNTDLSYQLKIDNNTIHTRVIGINYASPYKHFQLTNNIITSSYDNPWRWEHPQSLHFGNANTTLNGSDVYNMKPNNWFGFEITKTPAVNYSNTFGNIVNNPTVFPYIGIEGNFGPLNVEATSAQTSKFGIVFNQLKYAGPIRVGTGKNTTITQCTLNASSVLQSPDMPPIKLYQAWQTMPSIMIPPNGNIPAPFIKDATLYNSSGAVQVTFDLNSPIFNFANGPFVIEFFKSNARGDLLNYLSSVTLSSGFGTSLTHNLPVGLAYGDRIGATVTSRGSNSAAGVNTRYGTSPVGYFNIGDCPKCLEKFSPEPGKKYVIGGWVRSSAATGVMSYNRPNMVVPVLQVQFYSDMLPAPVTMGSPVQFLPEGPMVDGWQKIEGLVEIPLTARGIKVIATNNISQAYAAATGEFYFDDIRIFPQDGTMKSYAYDVSSKNLMAELDENNYATFYEYDEEGKLARVKKETEKGIMTIKESRNSKPIR